MRVKVFIMHRAERKPITYRHVIIMIVSAFCLAGLVGCYEVGPFPSNPIVQNKSDDITSGRMDSGAVRNLLGEPIIESRYWGVEVFREATSQTRVAVFLLAPLAGSRDHFSRYTIVAYDKDRLAESAVSDTFHRPGFGSSDMGQYRPIFLETRDFMFIVGDRLVFAPLETLLAKPARRDAYLQRARSTSQCTAVVGCAPLTNACSKTLSVDNGPSFRIPYRRLAYQTAFLSPYVLPESLAALSLVPGEHTLKASGATVQGHYAYTVDGEQSINFSCRAGEIVYLVINMTAERGWWSPKVEWKIDIDKDMPEFFVDRDLVIYSGDQWILNPEPEN